MRLPALAVLAVLAGSVSAQDKPARPHAPALTSYYGGVVLSAQFWRRTASAAPGQQVELSRHELTVTVPEGATAAGHHLEMRCEGAGRCYGEILAVAAYLDAPGGAAGDMVRVSNTGDGYAIARKTAIRGNDRYGSWAHQINLNRAHAGIAIGGDGADDGTDRTAMGVWISEHLEVTDAAIRYNQRPGATGWAIKMLASDGRIYGLDNNGMLHVRGIVPVP
jgi:hypothetical protein